MNPFSNEQPAKDDLQSLISDAQKTIQESDLPEGMKQELTNLLNDPKFVEELLAVSSTLERYLPMYITKSNSSFSTCLTRTMSNRSPLQ